MPLKRICLSPNDTGEACNITIDLLLNDAGMAIGRMVSFGVLGGLGENAELIEPFLLRPDGSMDFGTTYEDADDRDGRIERIRDRAFRTGEYFTVSYEGEEYIYRVTQILDHG